MTETILDIHGVVKRYEKQTAVDHISMAVKRGCIFGMLGPNGAGKTSLIRMITRITIPDEGEILFNGEKMTADHAMRIGYMPEERGLYKQMKVGEHIVYLAELRGLSNADARIKVKAWFEKMDIADWWNKKVEELSKGMQQKAQFIATIVHEPSLLILDEPFSGLDPINADLIKDEIHRLKENGATIIFSTHRMEQVEEICDTIVLIDKGRKILDGGVREVKQQFKKNRYRVTFDGILNGIDHPDFQVVEQKAGDAVFQARSGVHANALLSFLMPKIEIHSFSEMLPSLNEIFIEQVKSNHE